MEFRILGPLEVVEGDRAVAVAGAKHRALLAALLLRANEVVPAERLIDALWNDEPPETAQKALQVYVSQLRKTLGKDRVRTKAPGYLVHVQEDELDLVRFQRLVDDGSLREALSLWRGPPLAEFAHEQFALAEIARLEELHLVCLEERIEQDLAAGADAELVGELQGLVKENPLRERLHMQLMLALYRSGRQAEALEAYQRARRVLVEERGIEPGRPLRDLQQAILRQDLSLELVSAGSRPEPPGIKTFLIADVRGYTLFTESRGDEAAARLVTKFAQLLRDAAAAGGGSVAELRGDEGLAVFDSARQAIRSAIELQVRFMEQTVTDPSLPLAAGIGLDAGEAVQVDDGYRGGALNLATRLCRLAGPGEILASREVAHLAGKVDDISYVDRGQIRLEGLTEEVHVIRVRPEREDLADDTAFRRALGPMAAGVATEPGLGTRNPYKGLRAFEEADAADFFGREALTRQLVSRVAETRFLAVVGPSGSGKSSVVRAGLIPALRRGSLPGSEKWRVVEMVPGAYPLEELEASLLRIAENPPTSLIEQLDSGEQGLLRAVKRVLPADGSELVLVIDQLEEAFTLVGDDARRTHFLSIIERAVADPRSRLRVVTTLRADFYDRPLLYSGFAELLRDYVQVIVPLTPVEFERVISAPAHAVDLTLEPGLLAEMVADVAHEPGALPLLQYALTELYERRDGNVLTREAYRTIGGASGAVAGRAEELYAGLDEAGQDAARQLFLRLVTLGEGTEDTRRRVGREELDSIEVDPAGLTKVIDMFGSSRLLSFDRDPRTGRPTVEVAHEALLREWGRLGHWIDAAREDVRMHRRLDAAVTAWDESERDPSFLLRGGHLAQFEIWSEASGFALTGPERQYLRTSIREREAEGAAEEARRVREAALERRSVNRLRALVGVFALAALVAAGLTVFAFGQSRHSKHVTRIATGRQLTAASAANLDVDPQRSILLALQAIDTFRSTSSTVPREAVEALHRAVEATRVRVVLRDPATQSAVFSPDGTLVATAGPTTLDTAGGNAGGRVVLWDARTGKKLRVIAETGRPISGGALVFSPDGSRLYAVVGSSRTVAWDVRSGRQLFVLPAGGHPLSDLIAVSPDGRRLATPAFDGTLRIWNLGTRKTALTIRAPASLCGTRFSPDGSRVAAGKCIDGTGAIVWDAATGKRLLTLPGEGARNVVDVAFSPDGKWLATVNDGGKGKVWNARTGRLRATLVGHTGGIFDVAFSPDGRRLATGSDDATARVWDAASGRQLLVVAGHTSRVSEVDFSADGKRLLTGSHDGTARIWDLSPGGARDALTLTAHSGGVVKVAYSPDGRRLVSGGFGHPSARLWDASTGRQLRALAGPDYIEDAALSPDGRRVALVGDGGTAFVLDTGTGAAVLKLKPAGARFVPSAAWSPNGALIALASNDTATLWDARMGTLVRRLVHTGTHPGLNFTYRLAFTPDGSRLISAALDGTVRVWNVASGRVLLRLAAHTGQYAGINGLAVSPDGGRIATASADGTAKIWALPSGHLLTTLSGHSGSVNDVAFSPDGMQVATGGEDATVRLWDAATGDELLTLSGATLGVARVAYSPDGRRLAAASADGEVRIYILPLGELMNVARSRLTRSWTAAECQEFLNTHHCPATP